jgi:2-polyprenyl-3-methyl-5-hydroxy-6-metoxy-1,4-benzoquinol methylase
VKLSQDVMQLHLDMLNDRTRTLSFIEAIRETVRPGDVVLDIGTGTGILAATAARAGARHVYAIEAGQIQKVARDLFAGNNLSDRITLIRGWSTQVELPERADVLISEVIGHEPLAEDVLETTADAVSRLVKPDARLVPRRLRIFCLPVQIPLVEMKRFVFTPEALRDWQSWYGIEFDALLRANRNTLFRFLINPYHLRKWKPLGQPLLLKDIDFKTCDLSQVETTCTANASTNGQMNGLVFYFEHVLSRSVCLSTHPSLVKKDHHWSSPVWVLTDPLSLQRGTPFSVTYKYDQRKRHSWCEVHLIK